MAAIDKQIIQNPGEGRGVMWNDHNYVMNHSGEITFDVVKGQSVLNYYKRLASVVKFAALEDAMDYIKELGATEGTVHEKPYYSVSRADGCAFQTIGFFSVK